MCMCHNCPSEHLQNIYEYITSSLLLFMLPEPFVQVSHDPTVAYSGQQSVSADLCSASVVCDHSEIYQ